MKIPEIKIKKTHSILAAAGIALQVVGNVCLIAAAVGTVKEINKQVKHALLQEVAKHLEG